MVETENVPSTEKVSNDVRRMCKVVRGTKSLEREEDNLNKTATAVMIG